MKKPITTPVLARTKSKMAASTTDRFDDVGHLDELVAAEFGQQRHRAQEAEVVLQSADGRAHHHRLEDAPLQLPDVDVRHRCRHGTSRYGMV